MVLQIEALGADWVLWKIKRTVRNIQESYSSYLAAPNICGSSQAKD